MRIKLAILDQDTDYLNRLTAVFANKYSNIEVYSFTDAALAISKLKESRINVFIASNSFNIDTTQIPENCSFAYIVDSSNIETYKDCPVIYKYQKADVIYRNVLDIYSENVDEAISLKLDSDSSVRVITFISASGGVGSSSAAVACAKSLAANGQRTLYLNLEHFGDAEMFLSGTGQWSFSDVIYALKSKNVKLSFKLETSIREDVSGVHFYSSPKTAIDILELKNEEIQRLLNKLKLLGTYDSIVIDIDFTLDETRREVFKQSTKLIFVTDGSEIANHKFERAYKAIEMLDRDLRLLPRLAVLYNKFRSKTGKKLDVSLKEIGGAPRYENATTDQVITELVKLFSKDLTRFM